jgi:hypothetical protein
MSSDLNIKERRTQKDVFLGYSIPLYEFIYPPDYDFLFYCWSRSLTLSNRPS